MKKFKAFLLLSFCFILGLFTFACDKEPKKILVESITLNANEITLNCGETFDLVVNVNPLDAENNSIKYILTDNSVVSLIIDEENEYNAQIIAKNVNGPVSTYLQVVTTDDSVRSNTLKINVVTNKTNLIAPQNIGYNNLTQEIYWDNVDVANGYEVKVNIEGEEAKTVQTVVNSLPIDAYYDKTISVEVKSLGDGVFYTDSEYSDTSFKFIQMKEPENLTNDGSFIKFSKVDNAQSYNIFVYETNLKQNADFTYNVLDSDYNESVGYKINELETEGKTFYVCVQAVPYLRENVTSYPSKINNSIKITKFITPSTNNINFNFNYSTKTISWNNVENASGYKIIRTGVEDAKVYNFSATENYLVIDTVDDKLLSGVYSFTLTILGNNVDYLNSDESNSLYVEKLAAPILKVEDGILKWNSVTNASGYLFKIDDSNFTKFSASTLSYELGDSFKAKQYSFQIISVGDGQNSLTSETSEVFSASKLYAPSKAILKENKILKITTPSFVENMDVYLTYNNILPTKIVSNLIEDIENNVNYLELDMSSNTFEGGNYSVYARNYKEGYFTSNASEIYTFSKLNNLNYASILNGELNLNIPNNIYKYEIFLNGNEVTFEDNKFYLVSNNEEVSIISGETYSINFKYFPNINEEIVVSNNTQAFEFSKLNKAEKIYVEDGEIKLISSQTGVSKFEVKINENNVTTYNSLNSIKLEDDVTYEISMYYFGGSSNLNSDKSNTIKVKLIKNIDDFKLNSDTFSFTPVENSAGFNVNIVLKEMGQTSTLIENLENNYNFSLQNIVKEKIPNYNELTNPLEFYITTIGETLLEPVGNENLVIGVNRVLYANNNSINKSNVIKTKILPSPTNLIATKLYDLVSDSSLEVNELYFDCASGANVFSFKYNDDYKILTTSDLKIIKIVNGVYTYKIDTSFLASGTYNFELRAISDTPINTISDDNIIYNINSFDTTTLDNVTKLTQISSLSIIRTGEEEKIVISDTDTDCAYLLTINGTTIYDDVLGEGKDLNSLFNLIISNPLNSMEYINLFKNKERVIPSNYNGVFNVNCYKIAIPSSITNLMSGGIGIRSNVLNFPLEVTRISSPLFNLVNGEIQWKPVVDAESYSIYNTKTVDNKLVIDYNNKIAQISAGTNSFNIYNYYNGVSGNYNLIMKANTTNATSLSSNPSSVISFKILGIPTLKVNDGEIQWNIVQDSAGYLLEVYNNGNLFDSFIVNSSVVSYDAMRTSKDKIVEAGTYVFKIQALGALEGDTSTVMTSKMSSEKTAIKLETPSCAYVNEGKVYLTAVNPSNGVDYYGLYINNNLNKIDVSNLEIELNSTYSAQVYNFSYFAKGKGDYLTSNTSEILTAEKLAQTNRIYVLNGEIYFTDVYANNYKNLGENLTVDYKINVKRESVIKTFTQRETFYNLSSDNDIESDLYILEVISLGDNNYYLNSDAKVLNNVVKLGNISNLRIEDGKLMWFNPEQISAIEANTSVSPNGMQLILTKDNVERKIKLSNLEESFELDNSFDYGRYYVTIQNIGNVNGEINGYNYVNSKVIEYNKNNINYIYKLQALTNLNIKDGVNLNWNDPNTSEYITEFKINLQYIVNDNTYYYSGVLTSSTKNIVFENICYYVNDNDENILVDITDGNIEYRNSVPYYNNYEVKKFGAEGSFKINIQAYGNEGYITSDVSNTIEIIRPDPVTNLKVEHGKITWTGNKDANGYILTLYRTDLNKNVLTEDEEFNKISKMIYTNQNYYNLGLTNKIYKIGVRAYSLITTDTTQTLSSQMVEIEYIFNDTFINGGSGTLADPYKISNENELNYIYYNNFACYELINDISLSNNFKSLFTENYYFAGKFNGNGYKISNLTISSLTQTSLYVGLFGYISTLTVTDDRAVERTFDGIFERETTEITYIGTVENLNIENINITVGCYVGAIAGVSYGVINNVKVLSGNISSTSQIVTDIGASVRDINSGGLVAINYGEILNSESNARIYPTRNVKTYSGGISAENNGSIIKCVVTGEVNGNVSGGITAKNYGLIEGCEVTSNIITYNYISSNSNMAAIAGGITAINGKAIYDEENDRTSYLGTIKNCFVNNQELGLNYKGIVNTSSESLGSSSPIYMGGLVGTNIGYLYNNVISVDLTEYSVSATVGKIIGYNNNNYCEYNYCLTGTRGKAINLVGNGTNINNTNKEVESIINQNMVNELNNSSYKNTDIVWKIENNKLIID